MVNGTFIFISIVIIAVCAMLIMIILSQNPKGGGLSSTFGGGGGQMFGVQRTNNFLDRSTWVLSAIIAILIIVSNFVIPRNSQQNLIPDIDLPTETSPAPSETTEAPANNSLNIPAPEDNNTPAQ
ncbi:preprotein translocase subunit SecG [Flavobacteriaceae bacterium Ap0902]|nr:preprotein translocase subunit SecG [Flavobacteriaceae bacterium Ap0902]